MPHIANTPESLVSRSDSRNPATTCRGITANGLPCRRALASPTSTPPATPGKSQGQRDTDPRTFYCWQHKDQALSVSQGMNSRIDPPKMTPRTSIDTLMDRLGVLDLNEAQNMPDKIYNKKPQRRRICCCFEIIEEDGLRPSKPVSTATSPPLMQRLPVRPQQLSGITHPKPPRNPVDPRTKSLLSWIPSTLSPHTTSLLLTELAKPISEADEPGFIYMFWVTPSGSSGSKPPPTEVARSLIPFVDTPENTRRVSDAIRTAKDIGTLTSNPTPSSPGTVRLKIGRTSNVQRRLNEWTRQCSNHLTLIRYYPYTPSSPQHSPGRHGGRRNSDVGLIPGRKVPHVHRVERLIHIELADIRARDLGTCQECGKEHREWFEVAAEKTALRRVDECIRRWVKWAESQRITTTPSSTLHL